MIEILRENNSHIHTSQKFFLFYPTLTGVTQSKIGDVYLLASERSERDTYRGKNEKNRGCLFIGERA